jgi:hypothetical protein
MDVLLILYQKRYQPVGGTCLFCGQTQLPAVTEYQIMVARQTYGEACVTCAALGEGPLRTQAARRLQALAADAAALHSVQQDIMALLQGIVDQQYTIEHRFS